MWSKIWRITLKINRTTLLCYFKVCASFHSHKSIQTGVTVRKHQIRVKMGIFFALCDLEIWQMILKIHTAPLLCYFKLCASFHSHQSIEIGFTVRKHQIRVKMGNFLSCLTLKFDGWPWKTIGHLFLLCYFKFCASFHSHQSFRTGVTACKHSIQVKIGTFLSCVTLKFDR